MRKIIFSLLASVMLFQLAARAAETLPLAGEWRFALDRQDTGANEKWFTKKLPDKIQLPGILESQGFGDEISITTPWVLSLYDRNWFLRQDYSAYTNAGSVKVPFLCQPPRHYLGAAWYQRDIEIPTNWSGKRVVLFLERPKWKSTVWLDDKEIGSDISLCTPHEYDFGLVPPGKHRLTVRVDNRMILSYRPDAHSVSDSLGQAWNGIVGKMELHATPPVWIDEVQFVSNGTNKSAHMSLKIGNLTKKAGIGKLTVISDCGDYIIRGRRDVPIPEMHILLEKEITWSNDVSGIECNVGFGGEAKFWSEFSPALQKIEVYLDYASGKDSYKTIFGLRDLRTDGTRFTLNGQPLFLRGTHFGGDFPLTGYPDTDVESWKKIIQTCKDYGLNHMRFHSWCPPEAAFTAADELGFYLQVEPGMWNTFNPGDAMEKQLYTETDRIIRAYGNHPSFLLFSASNEPKGRWRDVLPQWAAHFRAADPRRLYTTATGFTDRDAPGPIDRVDYSDTSRFGPSRVRGETGWFGRDYSRALDGVNVPVISHEVGQWCAYPDFDMVKKLTGYMHPGNYEIFRDSAAKNGVLEMNKEFAHASGRFQLACYKEEIEAALRTPGLGGFQLLDLHDYTGQGTALIGLLDPLWGSKGYVTPDEFKEFCGPVALLARLKQRVFTTTDKLDMPVEIANFGPTAITNPIVLWSILDENGGGKATGIQMKQQIVPLGRSLLTTISEDFIHLPAPGKYTLSVHLQNTTISNTWNFWLYPQTISDATPTNVLVTSSPAEAKQALANGKKVLLTPRLADLSWWSPPLARVPIFWNALMGPTWSRMLGLWCDTNSSALAEFPTDVNCDWQWTEIIGKSRAINLDKLPRGLKPIVAAIDDWNRNYKLGVIFEARVGKGKLLVCTADLNSQPVGQQLRRSLLDYMAGDIYLAKTASQSDLVAHQFFNETRDKFQPATEITPAEFDSLFFDNLVMRKLGATGTADGKPASEILDGDPNTFWCSADSRGRSQNPPHEIVVAFPQAVAMTGLVLMPRQNHREHEGDIREYRLEISDDGTNWQTVASGELASTFDPQTISVGKTISVKQLRFTALSGFGGDQAAALAELAVVYAGPKLPENTDGKVEYRHIRTASGDIDAGDDAPRKPARKTSP